MELKKLLQVLEKNTRFIVVMGIVFGLFGLVYFYYFPKTYKTTGSFFVTRDVDPVERNDFKYEGYYAQQAGINYAGTLVGLFESIDIRRAALDSLGTPATAGNLRKAARNITTKRTSPQLVTLTVKAKTSRDSERFWTFLADAATDFSQRLNKNTGDPLLRVLRVGEFPLVYEGYNNIYVDLVLGLSFGLFLGFFIAVLKEYLS